MAAVFLKRLVGEGVDLGGGGGSRQTQRYQLHYNSITASIQRGEKRGDFAWGCTPRTNPPITRAERRPVAVIINSQDVIIKSGCEGICTFQTGCLIVLSDPIGFCDLL